MAVQRCSAAAGGGPCPIPTGCCGVEVLALQAHQPQPALVERLDVHHGGAPLSVLPSPPQDLADIASTVHPVLLAVPHRVRLWAAAPPEVHAVHRLLALPSDVFRVHTFHAHPVMLAGGAR